MQRNLAAFHYFDFTFPIFLAAGLDLYVMRTAGERNLRGSVTHEFSIDGSVKYAKPDEDNPPTAAGGDGWQFRSRLF